SSGDEVENFVQRHGWLSVERLCGRLLLLTHADRINDDEMGLVPGVGRDALQIVGIDYPAAAPFHLLEVGERTNVAHEHQALKLRATRRIRLSGSTSRSSWLDR